MSASRMQLQFNMYKDSIMTKEHDTFRVTVELGKVLNDDNFQVYLVE